MNASSGVETSRNPSDVCRSIQLSFSGYDTDTRELWDIPEVRRFVQSLDQDFPFWFYVADLQSDFLKVLAFCLCRVSTARPGATLRSLVHSTLDKPVFCRLLFL